MGALYLRRFLGCAGLFAIATKMVIEASLEAWTHEIYLQRKTMSWAD